MQAYPADKKWTLVHQDKLTEWQTEQKKRAQGSTGQSGAQLEGSPEWFVKKVLDGTITTKQLQSLSVSLRTQPIRYITFPTDLVEKANILAITAGFEHSLKLKVKWLSQMSYGASIITEPRAWGTRRRIWRRNTI